MKKYLILILNGLIFTACSSVQEPEIAETCIENYRIEAVGGPGEIQFFHVKDGEELVYSFDLSLLEDFDYETEQQWVSALGLEENEKRVLGSFAQEIVPEMYRDTLRLLLATDKIHVFAHLGAGLCLEEENIGEDFYESEFSGTHEYCTNECISEDFEFKVIFEGSEVYLEGV